MWPFRRRQVPRSGVVTLAQVTTFEDDYPVFTVGQSRLGDSFTALGFTTGDDPRFVMASFVPVIDPAMKLVADIEIRIDDHIVGYLRPPALNVAIALLDEHHAEALQIPVMMFMAPAGPEIRAHAVLA